jgi:hypothetical protein
MNSDEFLQDHAKWKYGKGVPDMKPEESQTWLMAKSGFYFKLEGDLDCEIARLNEMDMPCTVHHNQTSLGMSHIQATQERG